MLSRGDATSKLLAVLVNLSFHVREHWLKTGEGDIFSKLPTPLSELTASSNKELKPEYQEYVLQQIDLLLAVQKKEKEKQPPTIL